MNPSLILYTTSPIHAVKTKHYRRLFPLPTGTKGRGKNKHDLEKGTGVKSAAGHCGILLSNPNLQGWKFIGSHMCFFYHCFCQLEILKGFPLPLIFSSTNRESWTKGKTVLPSWGHHREGPALTVPHPSTLVGNFSYYWCTRGWKQLFVCVCVNALLQPDPAKRRVMGLLLLLVSITANGNPAWNPTPGGFKKIKFANCSPIRT